MKRHAFLIALALITATNIGAAIVAVHYAVAARTGFRDAAASIGQMGAAILDAVRRVEAR